MAKTDVPPPRFFECLTYNPLTGLLHWLIKTHGGGRSIEPGDVAGTVKDSGYVTVTLDGIIYRAHRLAWYYMTGEWLSPEQDIDHKDRVRSNNVWKNLRKFTRTQNNHNAAPTKASKSGVRGVTWCKDRGKWDARIKYENKVHVLGRFIAFEDAVVARQEAERRFGI